MTQPRTPRSARRRDPLSRTDPASVPRATWRSEIRGASGANALAGIWLIVSPFVLAYRSTDPVWTQLTVGAVITGLALVRTTRGLWKAWMSWANAVFGAGVFVLSAWVADSTPARWNGIVAGAFVAVVAVLSASATESARR